MSAVESRLAATLAKHGNRFRTFPDGPMSDRRWTGRCICGHVLECRTSMEPEPEGWLAEAHGRHVAAVIASSADLAVISLPEPQTEDDEGETVAFWPFSPSTVVRTYPRYGEVGWSVHGEPEEPVTPAWTRDFAAALLAAAKAAEGVSDR